MWRSGYYCDQVWLQCFNLVMAVRGVHAACMTKQGRMAHKTDDEIEVARLHWDALPNLLTSVSALDPGPECDIQYNQPFYCDCSRSLYQSSLGSPWQKSSCGESGVDIRQKRKQLFAARMQYSICLLYTSPSPRDRTRSRMPSSA